MALTTSAVFSSEASRDMIGLQCTDCWLSEAGPPGGSAGGASWVLSRMKGNQFAALSKHNFLSSVSVLVMLICVKTLTMSMSSQYWATMTEQGWINIDDIDAAPAVGQFSEQAGGATPAVLVVFFFLICLLSRTCTSRHVFCDISVFHKSRGNGNAANDRMWHRSLCWDAFTPRYK